MKHENQEGEAFCSVSKQFVYSVEASSFYGFMNPVVVLIYSSNSKKYIKCIVQVRLDSSKI